MKAAMFAVVGAILSTVGVGFADWQLYATIFAMAVASYGAD